MGQITYYLATSVDGYLARNDGSVDWLSPFQTKLSTPFDYEEFYRTVSAVLMGRKTWQVALSFEKRPYDGKGCYVFSRDPGFTTELSYVRHVLRLDSESIKRIKSEHGGTIWLVGGSEMASALIEMGELDAIVQTIVPVTIGSGIPWMRENGAQRRWELKHVYQAELGMVQLVYEASRTTNV